MFPENLPGLSAGVVGFRGQGLGVRVLGLTSPELLGFDQSSGRTLLEASMGGWYVGS